jgi:hypothetical protein
MATRAAWRRLRNAYEPFLGAHRQAAARLRAGAPAIDRLNSRRAVFRRRCQRPTDG